MKKLFLMCVASLLCFAFAETKSMTAGTKALAPINFTHDSKNWHIYVESIEPISETKVKVVYGFEKDTKKVSYTFTVGKDYELGHETNIFVNVGKFRLTSFDDNELVFDVVEKPVMNFK